MTSEELRQVFLSFFEKNGHTVLHSSPVVPVNDTTLLFTNAGMVPFKEVFLGNEKLSYKRATSVQRCIRAGGKHNDLENVGYTSRHHTFFEMLGNFSFGDYFKQEAIQYSWEFLTKTLKLPEDKLWITVFEDDKETEDIWLNTIKISPERFSKCGSKDNFWSMGNTGPCGPCSEIFYDHGDELDGKPPGSGDEDGDRYVEIWNLVFMQFNRETDGTLNPLPRPSVDTGMGLERLAAVMQGVKSNYDIDIFQTILKEISVQTGEKDLTNNSLKVIADHLRSCAFMIIDGVNPSNEGRGYVLRRIIRRAIRHGYKLGQNNPFFYQLVPVLVSVMGMAYPELKDNSTKIKTLLKLEEERFAETLEHGMKLLEEEISSMSNTKLSGKTVFKLYDTYGFPLDLTSDVAREKGLTIDEDGFNKEMDAQRQRARSASNFESDNTSDIDFVGSTKFIGYSDFQAKATILALYKDGKSVESLQQGQKGIVILDKTTFYAESGGQIGDSGSLTDRMNSFHVIDTQKQKNAIIHQGTVTAGHIKTGQIVSVQVDVNKRINLECNHSATHLLHAALRKLLGSHVQQKGSLVTNQRLRFDFQHFEPIPIDKLRKIEKLVNDKILLNYSVETKEMKINEAKELGAMALFGEKYGDWVRVVTMDEFSIELCGGTHVNATGNIGAFKIINETGIASGVRRIEAVTGESAWQEIYAMEDKLYSISKQMKSDPKQVCLKVNQLILAHKALEKQITSLHKNMATSNIEDLTTKAINVEGINVIAELMEGVDIKILRDSLDKLRDNLKPSIIVLAMVNNGKVNIIAGISKQITDRYKAGELVSFVAKQVDGKGGGRPDMAEAGGQDPTKLNQALKSIVGWVKNIQKQA